MKPTRKIRTTRRFGGPAPAAPVAADEVFVLDCGDARIASCRIARLETSAPDGTDAETLGLDFSVAKVAAKPSFRAADDEGNDEGNDAIHP